VTDVYNRDTMYSVRYKFSSSTQTTTLILSSAEVKGRVKLYRYSPPPGPSWPVPGRTLPLPFTHSITS